MPSDNDKADMQGTSMDDLPGTNRGTVDVGDANTEELVNSQQEAAEKHQQRNSYQ